jgi:hypothetical protein
MLGENEPKSVRIEKGSVLILSVIFVAVLLVAICALSVMVLNQLKDPRAIAQPDNTVLLIPPTLLPAAMPADQFSISLPVILSGSVSVSGQIWKVTKIKKLGYESGGQHYDLATFTRIDGQDIVQGYCINRGWDVPDIGTEYSVNAEGIFVPLYEPDAHPIQRFLMIQ